MHAVQPPQHRHLMEDAMLPVDQQIEQQEADHAGDPGRQAERGQQPVPFVASRSASTTSENGATSRTNEESTSRMPKLPNQRLRPSTRSRHGRMASHVPHHEQDQGRRREPDRRFREAEPGHAPCDMWFMSPSSRWPLAFSRRASWRRPASRSQSSPRLTCAPEPCHGLHRPRRALPQ